MTRFSQTFGDVGRWFTIFSQFFTFLFEIFGNLINPIGVIDIFHLRFLFERRARSFSVEESRSDSPIGWSQFSTSLFLLDLRNSSIVFSVPRWREKSSSRRKLFGSIYREFLSSKIGDEMVRFSKMFGVVIAEFFAETRIDQLSFSAQMHRHLIAFLRPTFRRHFQRSKIFSRIERNQKGWRRLRSFRRWCVGFVVVLLFSQRFLFGFLSFFFVVIVLKRFVESNRKASRRIRTFFFFYFFVPKRSWICSMSPSEIFATLSRKNIFTDLKKMCWREKDDRERRFLFSFI